MNSIDPFTEPLADPPIPEPLPTPRYQDFFDANEESAPHTGMLKDLADEIILIRARMLRIIQAACEPGISLSRLTTRVELFSRLAVRLARSLLDRQELYFQRVSSPEHRVDRAFEKMESFRDLQKQLDIRSSKNPEINLIIENPLSLSPLMRDFLKPLLYPKTDKLPTPGRPATDYFAVLEGILHKLLTRTPWYHLPANYPPYTTCHRYYRIWLKSGLLHNALLLLSFNQLNVEYLDGQEFEEMFGDFFPLMESGPYKSFTFGEDDS